MDVETVLRTLTTVRTCRGGRRSRNGNVKVTKIDQRDICNPPTFGGMRYEVGTFPNGKKHVWTDITIVRGPRLWFASDVDKRDAATKSDPVFETLVQNVMAIIKQRGGVPDEERVRAACERKYKRP